MRTKPSTYNAADVIYDLHLHSSASDGALDPAALLAHAAACGVEVVSITDHDTLAAYDDLDPGALCVIPGIEFSTTWLGSGIHVLGLDVDPTCAALRRGVVRQQSAREERAERIAERLRRAGIPDLLAAVRDAAGDGQIGRPQFATQLVERGIVRDLRSAYRKYLGRGKPGDVRNVWAPLDQILQWIHGSGGISVLAHPAKYGLTKSKTRALAREFAACGGMGLEVVCGPQTDARTAWLAGLANELGLVASCGSDFHTPDNTWSRPGNFPDMPNGVRPVWQAWQKTSE